MALPRVFAYAAAALVAVGAGIFAGSWLSQPKPAVSLQSGLWLAQPRAVGAFALTDQDQQPFTQAELQGRWTLLFAGFTHCPDVCPNTLGLLKAVEARMPEAAKPRVLFLSVDPERDTPELLAGYLRYFSPSFVGVTGPAAEIDKLCASLGLAYAKVPGDAPDRYTMDHSAALVLINPQAQVAAYFSPPFKIEDLTADLRRVLEHKA